MGPVVPHSLAIDAWGEAPAGDGRRRGCDAPDGDGSAGPLRPPQDDRVRAVSAHRLRGRGRAFRRMAPAGPLHRPPHRALLCPSLRGDALVYSDTRRLRALGWPATDVFARRAR